MGRYALKPKRSKAGGTLIFTSDRCSAVKVYPIIDYGIATRVTCIWGGERIQVTAVYRPCMNDADGALRTAASSLIKGNLDDVFWENLIINRGGTSDGGRRL